MSTRQRAVIDVGRDEILTSGSTITIDFPEGVLSEDAQRGVSVRGIDGALVATRAPGQFRWKPLDELPAGRHTIVVESLPTKNGPTEAVEVPFLVINSAAKISSRLRVEGFSRVAVSDDGVQRLSPFERPRTKFVDFVKAIDRRSGKPMPLAFDQDGNRVDGDALLTAQLKRRLAKTGGLPSTLFDAIQSAGADGTLLVDVWVEVDEPAPAPSDRPFHKGEMDAAKRRAFEERARCREVCGALARSIEDLGKVVGVSPIAPVVTLEIPATKVRELAGRKGVAGVQLRDETAVMDLGNSMAIAKTGVVHASGETGSGVSVAVWERGPTSNSDLVIAGRFDSTPSTSDHSQNVHAIIRNNEADTPDGHAPGCSLFSANSTSRDALTWAVETQECTVINQSFHRSSEPGSGNISGDDLYGDYLALHWPYPTIVHAAGNFWSTDPDNINPPSSEFVNHKGYNTISVGNHDDTASAMSGSSVFRNPNSGHADRELPEICANGTAVTADSIQKSGTSMASPAVAGIAALIQGTDGILKHWPEGCRAILTAGASRNVRDATWWQDVQGGVDARDGTGAVDAAESRNIALNRRWRGAGGTQRGWDVGLLTSSDVGGNGLSTFDYKVTVPSAFRGPRKVKVALCWTSKVARVDMPFLTPFYFSNLTVDLDLKVFDSSGNQVGYSGSWDNSYEIAEFTGSPGQTYTIRVRRWSGTDSTWYGLAWTVTGGFQIYIPWELMQLSFARLD